MFGQYPLACYDALLSRISAQTQAASLKGYKSFVLIHSVSLVFVQMSLGGYKVIM